MREDGGPQGSLPPGDAKAQGPDPGRGLSGTARRWLLQLARDSIRCALRQCALPSLEDLELAAETIPKRACFVSLHTSEGKLRGCIGTFAARAPLWEHVRQMAVAAATQDPRFPPLGLGELDSCSVEISALSPREPARPQDVVIGRHGLWVSRGPHSGVLLPQVATDHDWDPDRFISQTCLKAGLPADAWRDGSVTLEVFSAEVFGE